MTEKPQHISGYDVGHTKAVRAACLDLATRLGDLMDDLVIVGGMVPGLIISQDDLPAGADPHCGTMDIDLGLAVGLFDDQRYQNLTDRLRSSGFEPDKNEDGNITRQRWRVAEEHSLTIDFLVGPSSPEEQQSAGKLRNIESDFAAVITPGLRLAFKDRQLVPLEGVTRKGEQAERTISVCGPAAFIALKALAFGSRGENKDAYDLFYVMRNYGSDINDIVARFEPLRGDEKLAEAIAIIERDFINESSLGPMRTSDFIHHGVNADTLADVVGFSQTLLAGLKQLGIDVG
jgi:Nucleotidyl transferase AbiEii toxin, Type IV TA system